MKERLHRALLRGFRFVPRPVRRWFVRMISPSYTVGAVCFIERADGHLLLVRHAYRRRWGVPGGLLERKEAPADGVVREVKEEVGLDVVLVGEPAVVVDPRPQRIDIAFRARLPEGDEDGHAARANSPEIVEARWFPIRDLPELQYETASAFVALVRARGPGVVPSFTDPEVCADL